MNFKVGDRVTIKSNLRWGYYYGAVLVEDMIQYAGKTTTVSGLGIGGIRLVGCGVWMWSPDMLEGFDGYYLGNRVICGGEETTIVGVYRGLEYVTADGERHTAEDFERIPGYDYSKETTPEYRIGDYVRINVNPKVPYYGCAYFSESSLYQYDGLTTVVVDIMRDDHGTRYLLRGCPDYIHGTALTAVAYSTHEVGDTVVYDGEKAIIVSKEDGMCTIEFDGETRTVSSLSILPLEEVSIKLERDVFGIGSMGDVIKGYKVLDNVCVDSSIKCVSPQLFEGEYSIIEEG